MVRRNQVIPWRGLPQILDFDSEGPEFGDDNNRDVCNAASCGYFNPAPRPYGVASYGDGGFNGDDGVRGAGFLMIHTAAVLSDPAMVSLAAMGAILGLVPVNGYAWFLRTEGGLYKAKEGVYQPLPIRRLSLSWLLVSFPGMNKHAYDNKKWSQNAKGYANRIREFLKKITRQTDSNNGFTKIGNNFRDKLSAGVVNDRFHHSNDNMVGNVCQTQFSRVFALLGLTIP